MITIGFNLLNPLERTIHETLSEYSRTHETIRITEAAEVCQCSVSKISKFSKKLGFTNYKQYLDFLYGKEIEQIQKSSELTRLEHFIRDFDSQQVDEMIELIQSHEKIVLFGYGPSLVCAQYIEYRLRTCINKVIIAVSDDVSVASMTDENSLLLIFTVTGSFQSFEKIYHDTKAKGEKLSSSLRSTTPSCSASATGSSFSPVRHSLPICFPMRNRERFSSSSWKR